jgi:hypothetical protein
MKWSVYNEIEGMDCTQITEGADNHGGWTDNFLCLPPSSPFSFSWSSAGPIADSNQCVRWLETADPATWHDNFLCIDLKTSSLSTSSAPVNFKWNSAGKIQGMQCTQVTPYLLATWTPSYVEKTTCFRSTNLQTATAGLTTTSVPLRTLG